MLYEPTVIITIFLVGLTFIIPARYFLLPLVLAGCFVPADQRIIIMGLDFTVLRLILIFGIARIFLYGEHKPIRWNNFDFFFFAWAICGAFIYSVQWMNIKAVINRSGFLFDSIGLYWLFRQKIRSWNDIKLITKLFALSAVILLPFVMYEKISGNNPFVVIGRVVTDVREGRYRCQAAFPHSIMLGTFWVVLIPIFAGFARAKQNSLLYLAGIFSSIAIVFSVASSTPLAALLGVAGLLFAFKYRYYGRDAVFGLCAALVGLDIIMKKPVWHLFARMNIIGGSTGWHRYHLIDEAVNHFREWAFLGVKSTSHWGTGLDDITNEYILQGVHGGLITFIFFIVLLIYAIRIIYRYSLYGLSEEYRWLSWCICVSILAHSISFLGVSYFGQIMIVWYMSLAIAGLFAEYLYNPGGFSLENINPATS